MSSAEHDTSWQKDPERPGYFIRQTKDPITGVITDWGKNPGRLSLFKIDTIPESGYFRTAYIVKRLDRAKPLIWGEGELYEVSIPEGYPVKNVSLDLKPGINLSVSIGTKEHKVRALYSLEGLYRLCFMNFTLDADAGKFEDLDDKNKKRPARELLSDLVGYYQLRGIRALYPVEEMENEEIMVELADEFHREKLEEAKGKLTPRQLKAATALSIYVTTVMLEGFGQLLDLSEKQRETLSGVLADQYLEKLLVEIEYGNLDPHVGGITPQDIRLLHTLFVEELAALVSLNYQNLNESGDYFVEFDLSGRDRMKVEVHTMNGDLLYKTHGEFGQWLRYSELAFLLEQKKDASD